MVGRRRQVSSMTRLAERAQKGSGESSPVVSSGLAASSAATAISATARRAATTASSGAPSRSGGRGHQSRSRGRAARVTGPPGRGAPAGRSRCRRASCRPRRRRGARRGRGSWGGGGGGEERAEREVLGEPRDAAAVLEDERDGVGLEEALRGAGGAEVLVEEERQLTLGERAQADAHGDALGERVVDGLGEALTEERLAGEDEDEGTLLVGALPGEQAQGLH